MPLNHPWWTPPGNISTSASQNDQVLSFKTQDHQRTGVPSGCFACCWSHHECNTTCFFPWFFLLKLNSMNYLPLVISFFMGRWSTVHWSYSFESWLPRESESLPIWEKNRDIFESLSCFQHPFTCVFPCVTSCKKKRPSSTDCYRLNLEWPQQLSRIMAFRIIMGVGVLFGSFQASQAAPSAGSLGSQLPIFWQTTASHKILPPNFGEILKDFTCGGG